MRTLAIAVAIAACSSDPTLHVTVVHTTEVSVSSTTISVYDSKMFTCQDIEYGNVDASALQAALVAEETIDSRGTTGSLSNLPRTDDKMIVARGYDDNKLLVAAGCADKGVVSGADKVEVDTVPAAIVSLALADPTRKNDLYGIAVTLTDVTGKAIDGRQVWWRAYGPAGIAPDTAASGLTTISDGIWEPMSPSCTKNGNVTIHPVPPDLISGYDVELRVAWATDPPQQFSSFTNLEDLTTPGEVLPLTVPLTVGHQACTRHVVAGTSSLACLDGGATLHAFDVTVTESGGTTTLTEGTSVVVPQTTLGLVGIDNGTSRDVFAATADCALLNTFGTGGGHVATCTGSTADDFLYVPACGGSSHALVLFHVAGPPDEIHAIDLSTGMASTLPLPYRSTAGLMENAVALNAAGCVTELDPAGGAPTSRQVIVVDFSRSGLVPSTRALYNCSASGCSALELPLPEAAVGFLPGSLESRMVVPTVDASGVVLLQVVMLQGTNGNHIVERLRQPAASLPEQIVSGSFDNDSGADLLWDVSVKRGTSFELAYARMVGDTPLTALSGVLPVTTDQLVIGDVTNDMQKHDDITVIGQNLTATKRLVAVVPLQVEPPAVMLVPDSTCAP